MQMEVTFPGGMAVDAQYKGHTIHTDQPERAGGGDTGPAPFDLFLASIATCGGFYAMRFCEERQIDTEGLRLTLDPIREDGRIGRIEMKVHLPDGFPDKYKKAILRAVDQCAVKRHIVEPPEISATTV